MVNQLPEQLQSFLLYTSILERMSAPLCDAILEMEDSAALLEQLEQANLFVIALTMNPPLGPARSGTAIITSFAIFCTPG